jgi:hypothetical protein
MAGLPAGVLFIRDQRLVDWLTSDPIRWARNDDFFVLTTAIPENYRLAGKRWPIDPDARRMR